MGDLLWTCQNGQIFSSQTRGLQLTIDRASAENGYRFQVVQPRVDAGMVPVASGHCKELLDAIAAAEQVAGGFTAEAAP